MQWTVDANPPSAPGDPALFSGAADLRDEAIVRPITVPSGGSPQLTFNAFWNEEQGWDFGFAQISDDGGSTYTSLACTDTTSDHDPDALPTAADNVPGFTGFSGDVQPQTCSLAAYAGRTVLLAFRAFNDPGTLGTNDCDRTGLLGRRCQGRRHPRLRGSSLDGWKSFTETKPNTVAGFTVWILSIDSSKHSDQCEAAPADGRLHDQGQGRAQKYVDKQADFVAAIVFYDDPSETSAQYAPYTLTVNGVTQPGGS